MQRLISHIALYHRVLKPTAPPAIRGGAADAVKSVDLLLSDRYLFVAVWMPLVSRSNSSAVNYL